MTAGMSGSAASVPAESGAETARAAGDLARAKRLRMEPAR
jgi:hypothetical protein